MHNQLNETYMDFIFEDMDIEDAHMEYNEAYYMSMYNILNNIKNKKKTEFNLIDPNQYHTALKKFMAMGTAPNFPEKRIHNWKNLIVGNVAKLKSLTELGGHTSHFPFEDFYDIFDNSDERNGEYSKWVKNENENHRFPDDQIKDDDFQEVMDFLELEYDLDKYLPTFSNGQSTISDYGLQPLEDLIIELIPSYDPSGILVIINKILDVTHQRSDLAELFIRGGSSSLDKISNYEDFKNKNSGVFNEEINI